jgi:hypothetical protein
MLFQMPFSASNFRISSPLTTTSFNSHHVDIAHFRKSKCSVPAIPQISNLAMLIFLMLGY